MNTRPPAHSHHLFTLIAAFAVAAFCPRPVLSAPPITVDWLSVGTSNTNTVAASSGAIGNNNSSSLASLAVGSNNSVSASCGLAAGSYNFVGGFQNIVSGNNNSFTGSGSAIFGAVNQGVGNYNLMAGFNNRIYGALTSEAVIFGNSNSGTSLYDCLVSGSANVLTDARNSAALGSGLLLSSSSSARVVVGQFNADNETNARFVVGNGGSAIARSNAFAVYQNGTAKVGGQFVVTASTFPTYLGNANFALSSDSDRSISINASATGTGRNLTLQAGNSANGTDLAGGGLIFSGGNSTGSAGSTIEFRTAAGDAPGAGTRNAALRLKINAYGGIEAGDNLRVLGPPGTPQLLVGKYNDDSSDITTNPITIRSQGLLIVGAGDATNNRKNALRVTPSGTILVQPAGDISMGNFTAGEKP